MGIRRAALSEVIALFDKRLRPPTVLEQLCEEIELSGGIWLRVAAYPFPYRSALNFRIDYDEFHPAAFRGHDAGHGGQ